MQEYKFFNSVAGDERYVHAEDFADFFSQFLSSGIVHKNGEATLAVTSDNNDMQSYVKAGNAIVKGHLYKNTDDHYLQHEPAHNTYDRIDRVVLRYDGSIENRYIKLFVLTGVPSLDPVAPSLTRTNDIYELSLAQVKVPANSVAIQRINVVDERLDEELCGLADSLISVPVDEMKLNFNEFKSQLNDEFYNWFDGLEIEFNLGSVKDEIKLIQQNQIELLMQRYLEGQTTTMDVGYFFDILKDTSKIQLDKTTAIVDVENKIIKMNEGVLKDTVTWQPHAIGYVTDKVKHYHTRPIGDLLTVTSDALSGQNEINVANVKITLEEVIE